MLFDFLQNDYCAEFLRTPLGSDFIILLDMSNIQMFDSPASIVPSASTSSISGDTARTLRERCGFTLSLSFAPAFPNLPAKGHVGPTAGNLPRRKRSSVTSIDLPAPAHIDSNTSRAEYFAGDA
ncbi:hypothetical protein C8R44DRAFT_892223 [Mycena epipterygia]|nr:hypothetical protein C8R44DRAFT_892223 [Mycena epipterygia]